MDSGASTRVDARIYDNPALSDAEAWALVDAIGEENIGAVYIEGNGG
jgi:hypothetical protein